MILFFTGTGNSAFAARRLGALLQDEVVDLFSRIRSHDHAPLYSERPWVVVCPTYGWQMPRILRDWLRLTPLRGSGEVYFVLTCGSGIGNAGGYARALCVEKGLMYRGTAGVVMPENYLAMFTVPDSGEAKDIVRAALPALDAAAEHIRAGEDLPEHVTFADRLISGTVNNSFYAFSVSDRGFRVGENCVGCGKCASLCPLGNIRLVNGRPAFLGNCTHCMACICHCPQEAIEYGRKSVGQPRYRCPGEDEL